MTIAVGHSCQKLSELSRVYQSAVDALGYRSIVGVGQTIYINDVEPVSRGKLKFDNADENDFITAVKFGPEEKIRETIHSLMARMDDARVHVRQQQLYMLSLFNCVTRLMQQYDLTTREILIRKNVSGYPGSHWKAGGIRIVDPGRIFQDPRGHKPGT